MVSVAQDWVRVLYIAEVIHARETLKPNLSGYSVKRQVRRVPLPTPEGPESTRGGNTDIIEDVERVGLILK